MLIGIPVETKQLQAAKPKDCAEEMAAYLSLVATTRCRASYAKVFGYFAPRLRSYALKQVGNEALAMELVQDTMSNVWQKAHLFNAEKGSPSTWIFTIARNIRYDMLRKQQNRKEDICSDDLWPVLCETTADSNEVSLDQQVTLEEVGYLFEQLPAKQKAVIEAIYIEGKSQQEVADQLDIPLGTVKSRTRLALQRLKEMLQEYD
ncbi:sigma-70 family RNA polymerase sigma factor [Aestuariibacter sp. AA17]|uniref:Sigma-70 family RNA polymerase sigma factor n=1 Tax=Fluctibacter corallii TaxID=2984329 RepID=A0ABT3A3E3_9ALTE|nr:sigma-70 family RNA polymerase sigma factor [Aestuariibacter sp. AA17]MCV2883199.1 sigma-70 family RNA polymerase sigma factor [Aestuariibacter sp. AA17]